METKLKKGNKKRRKSSQKKKKNNKLKKQKTTTNEDENDRKNTKIIERIYSDHTEEEQIEPQLSDEEEEEIESISSDVVNFSIESQKPPWLPSPEKRTLQQLNLPWKLSPAALDHLQIIHNKLESLEKKSTRLNALNGIFLDKITNEKTDPPKKSITDQPRNSVTDQPKNIISSQKNSSKIQYVPFYVCCGHHLVHQCHPVVNINNNNNNNVCNFNGLKRISRTHSLPNIKYFLTQDKNLSKCNEKLKYFEKNLDNNFCKISFINFS